AAGIRVKMAGMKRSVMPRSLAQNRKPFCALIARNDGAQGAMVRRMNVWLFMRLRLPEAPGPDGARYAPSSAVNALRRQPMKGHLMRARLPEKPGPHCEPQSQSSSRIWVKNGPMKTCITPGNVSPKAQSACALRTPLEGAGRGKKRAGMGMTPTPPWAVGEAARCRARKLIDQMAQRESCVVRRRAVALLD